MQIDRIKYTKEFSYHGMSEWIGGEGSLTQADDFIESVLALKKQVVGAFNAAISEKEVPVIQVSDKLELEGDAEFEALKRKINEYQYREDAQAYLDTTEFKYAVAAKILVNQKPNKQ